MPQITTPGPYLEKSNGAAEVPAPSQCLTKFHETAKVPVPCPCLTKFHETAKVPFCERNASAKEMPSCTFCQLHHFLGIRFRSAAKSSRARPDDPTEAMFRSEIRFSQTARTSRRKAVPQSNPIRSLTSGLDSSEDCSAVKSDLIVDLRTSRRKTVPQSSLGIRRVSRDLTAEKSHR